MIRLAVLLLASVLAAPAAGQSQTDLTWHHVRGDDGYKAGVHSPSYGQNYVVLWLQCQPQGVRLNVEFEKAGRRGLRHPLTVELDGRKFERAGTIVFDDMDGTTTWSHVFMGRGDPLIEALAAGGNALRIIGRNENFTVTTSRMAEAMTAFRAACPAR